MLWRRLDRPGHEFAEVRARSLRGVALFMHDGEACRLDYEIGADESWRTVAARVAGAVGDRRIEITIDVRAGRWFLNDRVVPAVDGCIDVDLNFSPSTNLLPIRRLNLAVGEEASVRAAWLRFPGFTLEPLEQSYRRVADTKYRYSSAGGGFVAELEVDAGGLPRRYGEIWHEEQS
jgi:hypothetical protein